MQKTEDKILNFSSPSRETNFKLTPLFPLIFF